MSASELEQLERWALAVIAHRRGVRPGDAAARAAGLQPPGGAPLEELIRPSAQLAAVERIGVYANMYAIRLREVLEEDFGGLRRALGARAFRDCADAYVEACPPRHFSLSRLGLRLPDYLATRESERPDGAFLTDLARLEWTIREVFHAEDAATLDADAMARIAPEAWAGTVLRPVPALRFLELRYPVESWLRLERGQAATAEPVPGPAPGPCRVAVVRSGAAVRRLQLEPDAAHLFAAILSGQPLAGAIEACAGRPGADPRALAAGMSSWFRDWCAIGMFATLEGKGEA
ncbi:MAG TPA: DNA-binding domain-containing protein [Planctomycetota bacterium]